MTPDMYPDLTWCEDCDKAIAFCECGRCELCGHTTRHCFHQVTSRPEFGDWGDFDTPEQNARARELIRQIDAQP